MALGDLDPEALDAARAIPPALPGVAIVATESGSWTRARAAYVSPADAEKAAREHADQAPSWEALLSPPDVKTVDASPARLEPPQPAAPETPTLTAVPNKENGGEDLTA